MTTRDEPLLSIWARRAVTVPATLLVATLALVSAPLWLAGGIGGDLLAGSGRRLPRTRALVFFALYLGCEVAGILAASALWLGTLGSRLGGPARYLEANALLQRCWAATLFFGSVRLFSLSVSTEGLECARGGPFLLFVRHASTADTVLAAALVARPAPLLLRYVLKKELLRDPCIDIVGRRLPNTFAARQGPRREARIAAVARLAEGLDARSGVLIYPEGTRFSEAKRAAAVSRLKEEGRDDLAAIASTYRHVLPPRLGGPLALLAAAPGVDVVRKNVTIDWRIRENVRANLRVVVKRILRKYGYPPDKQEKATQTVLKQAEVLSEAWTEA